MGNTQEMKMQHGFILTQNDTFASHLVANGHHSRQVNISGTLTIPDAEEKRVYFEQKHENTPIPKVYFIFQAQKLDLPSLKVGHLLKGHIIKSNIGEYDPNNIVVSDAIFIVDHVFINITNPFFL
jgi:hypothetical protein